METLERLKALVIEGDLAAARETTAQLLAQGSEPGEILRLGLLAAMDVVGERMKAGDCFIPEVLLSARTMQSSLDLLKPHLRGTESGARATVVIGTVEGDLHDIGKNLVAMMLKGANLGVVDLGTNVSPEKFIDRKSVV
jgi:5-methyltetrahydrofolate--homocysteine methyltransferase